MKLISWNVNGYRACIKKGFVDFFKEIDADIFAIQETKMQEYQNEVKYDGYYEYWNDADKKGYSGTLVYTKVKPINVMYGLPNDLYNDEGRMITLEFEDFYFITTYVPNSKRELLRLDYRMEYEDNVRTYYNDLQKKKPVILCGDLNVAHEPIDLKNPKSNQKNAGYTVEERSKLTELLSIGLLDTFRVLHPTKIEYSWWSYMRQARDRNIGWRLDYFLTSDSLRDKIVKAEILTEIIGSDHCPVVLELKV